MPYITEYVYRPVHKPAQHRALTWVVLLAVPLAIVLIVMPFLPGASYTVSKVWPTHAAIITRAQTEAAALQPPGPGNWLLIPAIGVKTPIVDGGDIGVLDTHEGVWHQIGTVGSGKFCDRRAPLQIPAS